MGDCIWPWSFGQNGPEAAYNEGHLGSGERLDLNFVGPDEIPLPPAEVRVREIRATPMGDGRRIRMSVRLTPFLERPTLGLAIVSPTGEVISETTVVEADHPTVEVTMHLRKEPVPGSYAVRGSVSYGTETPQNEHVAHFELGGA